MYRKRAATECLLPDRAAKQPRLGMTGMFSDSASANQQQGALARLLSASVAYIEQGVDFLSRTIDSWENSSGNTMESAGSEDDPARDATRTQDASHISGLSIPNGQLGPTWKASSLPSSSSSSMPPPPVPAHARPTTPARKTHEYVEVQTPSDVVMADGAYFRSRAPPPSPHLPHLATPIVPRTPRDQSAPPPPPPPFASSSTTSTKSSPTSIAGPSTPRTSVPRSTSPDSTSRLQPSYTPDEFEYSRKTARSEEPSQAGPSESRNRPYSETAYSMYSHSPSQPPLRRNKSRTHVLHNHHKRKVKVHKKEQEDAITELWQMERQRLGFSSGRDAYESKLRYAALLDSLDSTPVPERSRHQQILDALQPAKSIPDLRSAARDDANRRHSFTGDVSLERALERARLTMESRKPLAPYTPTHDQRLEWLRKQDKQIEQRLRPKCPTELPPEDEEDVRKTFKKSGLIAKYAREQVSAHDIETLKPSTWLNDEVINFYGALLLGRSEEAMKSRVGKENVANGVTKGKGKQEKKVLDVHYFSSFFYSKLTTDGYEKGRLAKWTKKFDIFKKDIVLIPVNHQNMHWTAAAINFAQKRIESYDSMGRLDKKVCEVLREYLKKEHMDKKKTPMDFTGWVDYYAPDDTPQQENGTDCGVFTCRFLEMLSRGATFNFTQENIPYIRRRMVWEIAHAQLREDP